MQVWNVLRAARWKCRTQKKSRKNRHLGTIAQLCRAISLLYLRHISTIGKKTLLNSNTSPTRPHNMNTVRWFGAPVQISTGFASWQRSCTVIQQWASAKLCGVEQRAPPIFGRATITLGIGPHSSFLWFQREGLSEYWKFALQLWLKLNNNCHK